MIQFTDHCHVLADLLLKPTGDFSMLLGNAINLLAKLLNEILEIVVQIADFSINLVEYLIFQFLKLFGRGPYRVGFDHFAPIFL